MGSEEIVSRRKLQHTNPAMKVLIICLCVAFALVEAKPQGNAYFTGNNKAGNDLVGVQYNAAGSKPTYENGSKHVTYDVHGNTGPATFGDISGNSNRVGESSVTAGGGQSGTIKDTNSKDSGFGGLWRMISG